MNAKDQAWLDCPGMPEELLRQLRSCDLGSQIFFNVVQASLQDRPIIHIASPFLFSLHGHHTKQEAPIHFRFCGIFHRLTFLLCITGGESPPVVFIVLLSRSPARIRWLRRLP